MPDDVALRSYQRVCPGEDCGHHISTAFRFCPYCGHEVSS